MPGVELGEFVFGAGEADTEPFDLAEPAVAFGFGDAGDEVVPDFLEAGALRRVRPEERTSDTSFSEQEMPGAGSALGQGGRRDMVLNTHVVDWKQLDDVFGTAEQIPALLARVEQGSDDVAWQELGDRLCHQGETVSPASFAALPTLVVLARTDLRALDLAGDIVYCAMDHQAEGSLLRDHEGSIAELGDLLDRHLRTRPPNYLATFRNLLAARGHVRWSMVLGDFTDDFYRVSCPACSLEATVAIGDYGRYSAVRDWDLGDVDRRALRPAQAADLVGPGLWMHELAVRDGQPKLAEGLTFLFGQAECPRCASIFRVSEAHSPEIPSTERLT